MSAATAGAPGAGPSPAPSSTIQWAGVTGLLQCGSFELNRLLREKIAPLPVRVDGVTFWYADELAKAHPKIQKTLMYWRSRKRPEVRHDTTTSAAGAAPDAGAG